MFCSRCGQRIDDAEAAFCARCGQPLKRPTPSAMPATEAASPTPAPAAIPAATQPASSLPTTAVATDVSDAPPPAAPAGQPGGFLPGGPAPRVVMPTAGMVWASLRGPALRQRMWAGVALLVVVAIVGGIFLTRPHTPAAPTAPTGAVFFSDPLTSNLNNWLDDGTNCAYKSDGYHIMTGYICYSPAGANLGDGIIAVRARQLSGPSDVDHSFGIMLRRQSGNQVNAYEFDITSGGQWVFYKVTDDTYKKLTGPTANAAIHKGLGATNALVVRAAGSHFAFYVNGVKVGQADDSTYGPGRCALSGAGGDDVAFTSFSLALLR